MLFSAFPQLQIQNLAALKQVFLSCDGGLKSDLTHVDAKNVCATTFPNKLSFLILFSQCQCFPNFSPGVLLNQQPQY